jgi:DNA polymerase III epsilon subunit-like protein
MNAMMDLMRRFVYVDTETGGFYPSVHALLSVAAVEWGGKEPFVAYVTVESQPGKVVDPKAAKVNGYSRERWEELGAQPLEVVMRRLLNWMEQRPSRSVVAHNAAFDRAFLMEAERVTGLQLPNRQRWRCTQVLLGTLMDVGLVDRGGSGLDDLGLLMGTAKRPGEHGALEDAVRCMEGHGWMLQRLRRCAAPEMEDGRSEMGGI